MSELVFPKKYLKKLPAGFEEAAQSMSDDELKKKIVEYERAIGELESDMEADDKLAGLKEKIKEISEIYSIPSQESKAAIRYCIYVLKSRGK